MRQQIDSTATQWWEFVQQGRLHIQWCAACAGRQHPPGPICRTCHSTRSLAWLRHEGPARVVSKTEVRQTLYPAYRDLVPYWIMLVDLGGSVHTLTLLSPHAEQVPALGEKGDIGFMDIEATKVLTFETRGAYG